jgi:hypothetical protein
MNAGAICAGVGRRLFSASGYDVLGCETCGHRYTTALACYHDHQVEIEAEQAS